MLTPKPEIKKPLLGWSDLDDLLQAVFSKQVKGETPLAMIDPNEYDLSFSEIEKEAIENGYKVEMEGKYVKFT